MTLVRGKTLLASEGRTRNEKSYFSSILGKAYEWSELEWATQGETELPMPGAEAQARQCWEHY